MRCVQHKLQTDNSALSNTLQSFPAWLQQLPRPPGDSDTWTDVVIADIGGQALDIFLHGPESAHKNDIVKTFTHTSNPIQPCTLLKKKKKKKGKSSTHQMTLSLSCPLPVQSGSGRPPGSLAHAPHDCSTSQAFPPRTVLTENICRCVQHKLQHLPTTMPFLTTSTICLSCLASAPSPGWLLVTRTRGAWWCRYRGHWRSGPRHLSPNQSLRTRMSVKTFTHTSIPIQPCTLLKQTNKQENPQLTKHDAFVELSSSCPKW